MPSSHHHLEIWRTYFSSIQYVLCQDVYVALNALILRFSFLKGVGRARVVSHLITKGRGDRLASPL